MKETQTIQALSDAFMLAEEEIGHVVEKKLSAFLADARGLSRRAREALIYVYAKEMKRAIVDAYVRGLHQAADRITNQKSKLK